MGRTFKEMLIAGLFPGQGSEYVGMLTPLKDYKTTEEVFGIINEFTQTDIMSLALNGPFEDLKQPLIAQLSVFGTNVCYWHLLKERFNFYALLGHSLGFYSALYAAGSLELKDCINIIVEVHKAIEEICDGQKWAMTAVIGLRVQDVEKICDSVGDVFVANINSSMQVVISGKEDAVKKALKIALEEGALNIREMQIPYPLHSPFMEGIQGKLLPVIKHMNIKEPEIPVIDHTGRGFLGRDKIIDVLSGQLTKKVFWKDSVMIFIDNGIIKFLEIGPSDVLSKLVRWINRDAQTIRAEEVFVCQNG